jgi:glycosyltransferase involved in cell wall biosynthesis
LENVGALLMSNEQENPLVSVVIPTYKRPDMLGRAIDSVLNQTYDNIEIVVVDDNDEDSEYRKETEEFMDKYADNDNLVYLKHTENKGGSAARNTGIKTSEGEYIAFLDDDDIWVNTKLKKQIEVFKNNNNLGLVYCRMYSFKNNTGEVYHKKKIKLVNGSIYTDMLEMNYIGTPTALVKKICFQKVGLFDIELLSRQDHDMFLRISKNYDIDYVDEFLVKFSSHDNKISRNINSKEKGWKIFLSKWENELNEFPKEKKKLYDNYYFEMAKLYYKNNSYNKAKIFSKKMIKNNIVNYKGLVIFILSIFEIDINLHNLKEKFNI